MKRYAQVIRVIPEKLEYYKKLHAAPWPEVLDRISRCHIKNYSIYHRDGYLFACFEYHGSDFEGDMERMAADPATRKWWDECKPCQRPLDTAEAGGWWADMEEVFHLD